MDTLVSVIVPAYHVADYIEKCVRSILGQTYRHIEIILVDDGSWKDETGPLCDMLAGQDSRVKVLHKKNGGLVSARKAGLAAASGEYILNVDGDDWIEDNMVENLLRVALESTADIVTSGMYKEAAERQTLVSNTLPEEIYSSEDSITRRICFFSHFILNGDTDQWGILPSLCAKLFRRTLIQQVLPTLSDSAALTEDAAVTYSCCMKADRIVVTHDVYYHYINRSTSITHTPQKYFLKSLNEVYICMKRHAESSPYYNQIKQQMDLFLVRELLQLLPSLGEVERDVMPPVYSFRSEEIPLGSSIALYGAGKVGQAYFRQIKGENLYDIAVWVDKDWKMYKDNGLSVAPVADLAAAVYDYVIVAVANENMADDIREQLITEWGIRPEKIFWKKPESLLDRYFWT